MQGPFHAEARGPRPAEHNLTWAPSLSHAAACSGLHERRPDRRSPDLVRVGSPAQRAKRGPVLRTGLPGQTRPSQPGRTTRSSPVTWEGSNAWSTGQLRELQQTSLHLTNQPGFYQHSPSAPIKTPMVLRASEETETL